MTRKIALLITLVMIFSISCVYAVEPNSANPADSAVSSAPVEATLYEEVPTSDGVTTGADLETTDIAPLDEVEDLSGEVTTTDENTEVEATDEASEETGSSNSTVIGAVIAIILVIAVIAVVYVLQKK